MVKILTVTVDITSSAFVFVKGTKKWKIKTDYFIN